MNKIKIVVDSTVDLTEELYKEVDAEVIPLSVILDGKAYKDGLEVKVEDVFKYVSETGKLPGTAAVSPDVFASTFKKLIDEGYDVIYIGIGSTLSSAFQNAYIASQDLDKEHLFLVDSKNLSSGSGLLVMKAHQLIKNGLSAKEIAAKLEEIVPNVVGQFVIDKLDYLHKGGRCSGASKLIGTLFHVHPVLRVENGKLLVRSKPRGLIKMGILEQLKDLKNELPVDENMIFVTYPSFDQDLVDFTIAEIKKLVPGARVEPTIAGTVIASHCGPNTLGILYIRK